MPFCLQNESRTHNNDCDFCYVHLYKLHHGMTSVVIQDNCSSPYSQGIAMISFRGTDHVLVLFPFGSKTGFQMQNSHLSERTLLLVLSLTMCHDKEF